jgi:hypothetical protein
MLGRPGRQGWIIVLKTPHGKNLLVCEMDVQDRQDKNGLIKSSTPMLVALVFFKFILPVYSLP